MHPSATSKRWTQFAVALPFMRPSRRGKETGAFGNRQAKWSPSSWHEDKSFRHLNMEKEFNAVHTNAVSATTRVVFSGARGREGSLVVVAGDLGGEGAKHRASTSP